MIASKRLKIAFGMPPRRSNTAGPAIFFGYVTKLVETLPKTLKGSVPSIREIESGLSATPEAKKKPTRKRAQRKPKS